MPKAELEAWEARDPVDRYRRFLLQEGILTEEQAARVDARVRERLDEAVAEAEAAPLPDAPTALEGVWSTPRWTAAHPNFHDFEAEIVR